MRINCSIIDVSAISSRVVHIVLPALLTKTSKRSNSDIVFSTRDLQAFSSVTSVGTTIDFAPADYSSSFNSSSRILFRAANTRFGF